MYDKYLRVAGVTKKNENDKDIQTLLKTIASGYKREDKLESWNGYTKKEMLEDGMSESEFEGQDIPGIVSLVEDPDNPYDPNAIKVYLADVTGKNHHVGYVKKDYTRVAKSLMNDEEVSQITAEFAGGRARTIDYDVIAEKDTMEDEELTRGLTVRFKYDYSTSIESDVKESDASSPNNPQYDNMTDKQKAAHDKWMARSKKMEARGKGMQQAGGKVMGCGCLLTLIVTIPIILIVIFFL